MKNSLRFFIKTNLLLSIIFIILVLNGIYVSSSNSFSSSFNNQSNTPIQTTSNSLDQTFSNLITNQSQINNARTQGKVTRGLDGKFVSDVKNLNKLATAPKYLVALPLSLQ
ncbi:MAG: hypothetical protein LBC17_01920 [Lactobacillaceae bacterium]|jgi:hypothetical protein|nr:hypothetical protein [Lactobacillaceae bacterium]